MSNILDFEAHNLLFILHFYGQKELFELFTAIHLDTERSTI
jgi:hypothetical protein